MAADPNLTQFAGVGPVKPPEGADPSPEDQGVDFSIPSPWENPDLWDNVLFHKHGDDKEKAFTIAPDGVCVVSVSVEQKAKIDKKGGAGKKKPRSTTTGGEAAKVKVSARVAPDGWPYLLSATRKLLPGEVFEITHPKTMIAGVLVFQIETVKDAPEVKNGELVWEIDGVEVKDSAQTGKGGGNATNTPGATDSQRWKDTPKKDAKKFDPNPRHGFDEQQQNATKP